MEVRKQISLLITICFLFSQMAVPEAVAEDETCQGGSSLWSGGAPSDPDSTCGICNVGDGSYTQTRSVGSCQVFCGACHPCECDDTITYVVSRTQTVEQITVSLAAQQTCDNVRTVELGAIGTAAGICASDCSLGAPLPPVYAACIVFCGAVATAGVLAANCAYNECSHDCELSGWVDGGTAVGCFPN